MERRRRKGGRAVKPSRLKTLKLIVAGVLIVGALLIFGGRAIRNAFEPVAAQNSPPSDSSKNPVADVIADPLPITPAEGAKIYSVNCLICHGGTGNGQGPLAVNQPDKPRNFTDASWMANHADGTFFTSISRGVPGTSMPAFANRLSEREIWAAVKYIRGFSPETNSTALIEGQNAPRTATENGTVIYAQKCAGCHGDGGRGNGTAAVFFVRAPRDLTDRDWMASRDDEQLRGVIRHGVAGSPMPGFADELPEEQIAALVLYLRNLSGTRRGNNSADGAGGILYAQSCAACHGAGGDGSAPGTNQLSPRPRDFRNPYWMTAQTDEKLAAAIRYGRPGTNMPPFGAILTADETAALVRYIRGFAEAIPGAEASRMVAPGDLPGAEFYKLSVAPSKQKKGR